MADELPESPIPGDPGKIEPKKRGGARPGAGRKEKTVENEALRLLFGGRDMNDTSGMEEIRKIVLGDFPARDKIAAVRLLAEIASGKFAKETPGGVENDPTKQLSLEELQAKAKEILGELGAKPEKDDPENKAV